MFGLFIANKMENLYEATSFSLQPGNPDLFLLLPHVHDDFRRLKVSQLGAVVDPRVGCPLQGVQRVGVDGERIQGQIQSFKNMCLHQVKSFH